MQEKWFFKNYRITFVKRESLDLCWLQNKFSYIRKLKKSSCEQWSNLKIQNDGTILHNSPIFLLASKREQNAKFSNCQNKLLLILKSEILFWAQKKYHSNLNYWLFKIFIVSQSITYDNFSRPSTPQPIFGLQVLKLFLADTTLVPRYIKHIHAIVPLNIFDHHQLYFSHQLL